VAAINPKVIEDLRALASAGSPGFLAELIDLYLAESKNLTAQIRKSFDARDAAGLDRSSHTLKGSSGNLGAQALSRLCADLQAAAKSGSFEKAGELVPLIEAEHALACAELEVEKSRP
jgi:HPt (histidine-containing phosphotransfer) domain-containing protein